jgi:hypothetical protein
MPAAMRLLLVFMLALSSAAALAQPGRGRPYGPGEAPPQQRPLAPEERERLRSDMRRDTYEDRAPGRPLPPEERERLRRDVRDAYRDAGRRR